MTLWRRLIRLWTPAIPLGRLVVMACSDEPGRRVEAIEGISLGRRPTVVGGARSNHLIVRSARLSLVTASKYGRTPIRERGTRMIQVVNQLELNPLLEQPWEGLSAISRLRVGLGIGLLSAPELLIVDEPAGLPEPERTRVVALFRRLQLRTKLTTVWLTSRPVDIAALTDHPLQWAHSIPLIGRTAR